MVLFCNPFTGEKMKNKNDRLEKLFVVTLLISGIAWIATIIYSGILSQSFLFPLVLVVACAIYFTGFFKFFDMSPHDHNSSSRRYFYWCLMITGLLLASYTFFNLKTLWMGLVLSALQVPPFLIVLKINSDVLIESKKNDILKSQTAEKLRREQQTQMATQRTNIRGFAGASGMNVIDLRSDHEKQLGLRAIRGLDLEDEKYSNQLVAIFKEMDALFETDKTAYDRKRDEARKIGQILGDNGGNDRMTLVANRVQVLGGRSRDCERAWEGICGWMA
jgi:hypothetical protein